MATETGKQRSQRIQIDYYRQRTGLHRFRSLCVILGLLVGLAYAAYAVFSGGSHVSTGPLASVHASFENDCQQCHRDWTPMDRGGAQLNIRLIGIDPAATAAHAETACQKCHEVGDHHRNAMSGEWKLVDQNCSGCHADHQGRDHDLTRLTSQRCVDCHADLAAGCTGVPPVRSSITSFDKSDHGDFPSLALADPGKIKFDHGQHMLAGQVDANQRGGFTVGQLPPQDRERYRKAGQDDSALVSLDCSSCHQLSGVPRDGQTLISDQELGRYIEPIRFEEHCAACHSLNPGIATQDSTPLPHAVPWRQLDLLLAANAIGAQTIGLARRLRTETTETTETQTTPVPGNGIPVPGNGIPVPGNGIPVPGEGIGDTVVRTGLATEIDVTIARGQVEAKCLQCHDADSITDASILASRAAGKQMIPTRWLQHGLYDHAAHQKIDCRYCHQGAYPDNASAGPADDHRKVMISGIDSCADCHRSEEQATPSALREPATAALIGGQPPWASDRCTLCHRYHTALGSAAAISLPASGMASSKLASSEMEEAR